MVQGVLRLVNQQGCHSLAMVPLCNGITHHAGSTWKRLFSSTSKLLEKVATPPPPVKGIPYKNITIGVPKEIWQNEKRYAYRNF